MYRHAIIPIRLRALLERLVALLSASVMFADDVASAVGEESIVAATSPTASVSLDFGACLTFGCFLLAAVQSNFVFLFAGKYSVSVVVTLGVCFAAVSFASLGSAVVEHFLRVAVLSNSSLLLGDAFWVCTPSTSLSVSMR